jgi:hypothetical protein
MVWSRRWRSPISTARSDSSRSRWGCHFSTRLFAIRFGAGRGPRSQRAASQTRPTASLRGRHTRPPSELELAGSHVPGVRDLKTTNSSRRSARPVVPGSRRGRHVFGPRQDRSPPVGTSRSAQILPDANERRRRRDTRQIVVIVVAVLVAWADRALSSGDTAHPTADGAVRARISASDRTTASTSRRERAGCPASGSRARDLAPVVRRARSVQRELNDAPISSMTHRAPSRRRTSLSRR